MQSLSNVGAAIKALIEGINNGVIGPSVFPFPVSMPRQQGPKESEASEEGDVQPYVKKKGIQVPGLSFWMKSYPRLGLLNEKLKILPFLLYDSLSIEYWKLKSISLVSGRVGEGVKDCCWWDSSSTLLLLWFALRLPLFSWRGRNCTCLFWRGRIGSERGSVPLTQFLVSSPSQS